MFSGIVKTTGEVVSVNESPDNLRVKIKSDAELVSRLELGASVAVSGVCLTVVKLKENCFSVDISNETLSCTTLGMLRKDSIVNLEPALRLEDSLDGHFVSGHVDGVGSFNKMEKDGESKRLTIFCDKELLTYIVPKGSVCVDGVSLTVNEVEADRFTVNIIPYTCDATTFGQHWSRDGTDIKVNIEVDLIARYLEKLNTKQ